MDSVGLHTDLRVESWAQVSAVEATEARPADCGVRAGRGKVEILLGTGCEGSKTASGATWEAAPLGL